VTAARSSDPPGRPLGRAFFARPARIVARALLGTSVYVGDRAVRLVETEAYVRGDPASHAFRGRTPRNRSMFGPPGTVYVFRIHRVVCANFVCRRGEGVLLRAGEPLVPGLPSTSGPGRLASALGISMRDDGARPGPRARFRVYARTARPRRIRTGPRIGIRWGAERPLRFWIPGSPAVSRPRGARAAQRLSFAHS